MYYENNNKGGLQFTHLAGIQGFTCSRNALLLGKSKGKVISSSVE